MGVAAEGCSGRESVSYIVAAFVAVSIVFLLVEAVPASQGAAADFKVSETCYGTGNCSLHTLSCSGGKLAVLEASYAFKPKQAMNNCINAGNDDTCPDNCCSYNETSDCKETYTTDNLKRVQSNCSHSASCQMRAQWAKNVKCSPGERADSSSVSVLRAVCVPAATAVDPCANATVSGHTVSLDLPRPPLPSSPCQCTVHKTTTANATTATSDNDNNNGTVEVYVYEAVSSSADWGQVVVEDSGGAVLWQTSGVGTTFPAIVVSPSLSESSLPLSASFSFQNLSDIPRRLWLGFRGEESSLTLRCGQDAVDYAMSLITTTTTPPTTMEPTTTAPATISTEQGTTSPGGADSTPLTSDPPKKDTNDTLTGGPDDAAATNIIIYTMVGVSGLLLLAFLYVFIRQLRKKRLSDPLRAQSQSYTFTPTPSTTEAVPPAARPSATNSTAASSDPQTTTTTTTTTAESTSNPEPTSPPTTPSQTSPSSPTPAPTTPAPPPPEASQTSSDSATEASPGPTGASETGISSD